MFVLSLSAGCMLINIFNHKNDYFPLEEKIDYLKERKDEYNTLFVGDSRVLRHLIPYDFDQYLTTEGVESRSYNLGFAGANYYEIKDMLERVRRMKPAALKWVFIEVSFKKKFIFKNGSLRNFHLYRVTSVFNSLRYYFLKAQEKSFLEKVRIGEAHFKMLLLNYSNRGLMSLLIRHEEKMGRHSFRYLAEKNGFIASDQRYVARGIYERDLKFHGSEEAYKRKSGKKVKTIEITESDFALIRELIDLVHDMGAKAVLIQSPSGFSQARYLKPKFHISDVLWLESYQDVERYPELFEITNRFDPIHLKESGARIYTRLVAQDFVKQFKEQR